MVIDVDYYILVIRLHTLASYPPFALIQIRVSSLQHISPLLTNHVN